MHNSFHEANPIVSFAFFSVIVVCSVLFFHPVLLTISLLCALCYSVYLKGLSALKFFFGLCVPAIALTALINSLFCHYGVTVLFILPSGNSLTLESLLYGICAGATLASVMLWFSCYNFIFTTDKFLYVFGRFTPAFSLIISMALRFIPRYRTQIGRISQAQSGIHHGVSDGNVFSRIRHGVSVISVLTTWALENGVETSDSMRARGYGLKGRTSFSLYRFDRYNTVLLTILILLTVIVIIVSCLGAGYVSFNPRIDINMSNDAFPFAVVVYTALCLFPLACDTRGEIVRKIRLSGSDEVCDE